MRPQIIIKKKTRIEGKTFASLLPSAVGVCVCIPFRARQCRARRLACVVYRLLFKMGSLTWNASATRGVFLFYFIYTYFSLSLSYSWPHSWDERGGPTKSMFADTIFLDYASFASTLRRRLWCLLLLLLPPRVRIMGKLGRRVCAKIAFNVPLSLSLSLSLQMQSSTRKCTLCTCAFCIFLSFLSSCILFIFFLLLISLRYTCIEIKKKNRSFTHCHSPLRCERIKERKQRKL